MEQRQYYAHVLKAWTKDTLADKIEKLLDPMPPERIVSIEVAVDFQFFVPWRRNWAMIVLRPDFGPAERGPLPPAP
jgi:hypothetical protein